MTIAERLLSPRDLATDDSTAVAWQFSAQWEMLELADGSLFFDSVYGNHRLVADPPSILRQMLSIIEGQRPTLSAVALEITGNAEPTTVARIERMLRPFTSSGIIVPLRAGQRPDWAHDALVDRFSTQLEWLGTLAVPERNHWDYFARLRQASVAVLGLGGAGSLLAQALTAVGIGRLTLVDGDIVSNSNLVRQILYKPSQIGTSKAYCLADQLREFSPYTEIQVRDTYVTSPGAVAESIEGADFVAVCADAPRFVLNRWIDTACKNAGIPYLGAFAGSVGPMYRPGAPGCFGCFEERMREELPGRYDLVVDALAAKKSWQYPAFVAGPLTVSHLMTTEILLYLTGAARPATAEGILRYQHPQTVREAFPGHSTCDCRRPDRRVA